MSKEAMKLALGKIKSARECHPNAVDALLFEAEEILEEALAEQPAQQEPFCWCIESVDSADWCFAATKKGVVINSLLMDEQCVKSEPFALYAAPPAQRTWVGLTDEEITDIWAEASPYYHEDDFARAIEDKLKEKNT